MNVLAVLQAAANELGIQSPAAYSTNTQLLNHLYSISRELRNTRVFTQQKRTHSFSTSDTVDEYALPADFYSPLPFTQFNQTSHFGLIGPVGDDDWNFMLYVPGASGLKKYRIFGPNLTQYSSAKMMKIKPTPTATETVSYDYITSSMFYQSGWTPTTTVKESVSADTDVSMFDDDILIEGLKYKWKEAHNQEGAETYRANYQRMIERAVNRYNGNFRGSFSRYGKDGRRYYPSEGDGGWTI